MAGMDLEKLLKSKKSDSEELRAAKAQFAWVLDYEKSNAAFKKMSKSEKRVTIAQDALRQIEAGVMNPTSGTYVEMDGKGSYVPARTPLREYVSGKCDVCAKGALFVASVGRVNGVKVKDFVDPDDVNGDEVYIGLDDEKLCEYMEPIFEKQQLNLMESCFERHDVTDHLSVSDVKKARKAQEKAKDQAGTWDLPDFIYMPDADDQERLTAILENVIENKGTFVLKFKDCGVEDDV